MLITALAAAAIALWCFVRLRNDPIVYACCYFATVGTVLGAIDIALLRLPDWLTLPSYPILFGLVAAAAVRSRDYPSLSRSMEAALVLLVVFAVTCAVSDTGLGDLKLAGLAGLLLGHFGWHALFRGLLLGFVTAASWVLVGRLRDRPAGRLPLGPFMVAGTLAAILM